MENIQQLQNEVQGFLLDIEQNHVFNITCDEDYRIACDTVKIINTKIKEIENKRKEYTKPLDETKRKIMADSKLLQEPLKDSLDKIKEQIKFYYIAKQERLDREQAELEAEAIKTAKENGDNEVQVDVINKQGTVKGNLSSTHVRKIVKFRVVDFDKIPRSYLQIDESKINEAIKDGSLKEIPGIEIYEDVQPIIR